MGLAERCLDPLATEQVAVLSAAAAEPPGGSPNATTYWSEAFQRLTGTLRLRAVMLAELRGAAGPPLTEGTHQPRDADCR
jgi:hypothetical protein